MYLGSTYIKNYFYVQGDDLFFQLVNITIHVS